MITCLKAKPVGAMLLRQAHSNSFKNTYQLPLEGVFVSLTSIVEKSADSLFENLRDTLCRGHAPTMIAGDGDGTLIKRLLQSGAKNLHITKKGSHFSTCAALKKLEEEYCGKCKFHNRTFNQIFFENQTMPVYDSDYLKQSLPFKLQKKWDDAYPSLRIVCSHSNGKVLIFCFIHLIKNMMYHGMGRPQLILTFPRSSWDELKVNSISPKYLQYHNAALLFPDFYLCEELGTLSPPVNYFEGNQKPRVSKEEFVTVSFLPKVKFQEIAPEILEEFLFFGTQTMNGQAKHGFLIQTLERWVSGSGKVLVANDVDCFTRISDLSAKEAVRIFKIWREVPNFGNSIFMLELKEYLKYAKD